MKGTESSRLAIVTDGWTARLTAYSGEGGTDITLEDGQHTVGFRQSATVGVARLRRSKSDRWLVL